MYQGIDYGIGMVNIDKETGIRYGVIPVYMVGQSEQFADDTDIIIMQSPYYTLCSFCSPCAPGAGDLTSPIPDGVKAYCFGHDWFDSGRAPYPVYSVKTGKLVEPKK